MIPVKSISLLQPFKNQQESIIQFENFNTDSTIIGLNRYSISAENFDEALFAGDLKDNDMFIEVSYLDPEKKTYVPRKFDFSNYLKYIEDALSVLNNGILGVYLTEARANDLYVKKAGDTMYGSLVIDLQDGSAANNATQYPILINDARNSAGNRGYISMNGKDVAGIKMSITGNENAIELIASESSSLKIDNVFEANGPANVVEIKKPLLAINTKINGTLSASGNLSAYNAFCKNITLNESVCANSITGDSLIINNFLSATDTNVEIETPTTVKSLLTMTGDTFTILNANAKIQFGTSAGSKSSLKYDSGSNAFVMSGLIILPDLSDKSIVEAKDVELGTTTDTLAFALKVYGNSLYEGSMFGELAIRGEKLVTENFEADRIEALNRNDDGGFVLTRGIADLTAKRACWA